MKRLFAEDEEIACKVDRLGMRRLSKLHAEWEHKLHLIKVKID